MAYRIRRRKPLPKQLHQIVRRQIDRAIKEARDDGLPLEMRVHQVRARLKRARAAVRLVREDAGRRARRDDRWMRDLRRELAHARELTVESQTLRRLIEVSRDHASPALGAALERAEQRAARHWGSKRVAAPLEAAVEELRRRRRRAARWRVRHPRRTVRRGVELAYRRARRAFLDLGNARDAESFHEWRKAIKTLAHQLRLLRRASPELWASLGAPLEAIGTLLGDAHDLDVLRARVAADQRTFGSEEDRALLVSLAEQQMTLLHEQARAQGASLLVASPREIAARVQQSWSGWGRRRVRAA
jgi:CHAD domain-containing protein